MHKYIILLGHSWLGLEMGRYQFFFQNLYDFCILTENIGNTNISNFGDDGCC